MFYVIKFNKLFLLVRAVSARDAILQSNQNLESGSFET